MDNSLKYQEIRDKINVLDCNLKKLREERQMYMDIIQHLNVEHIHIAKESTNKEKVIYILQKYNRPMRAMQIVDRLLAENLLSSGKEKNKLYHGIRRYLHECPDIFCTVERGQWILNPDYILPFSPPIEEISPIPEEEKISSPEFYFEEIQEIPTFYN